MHEGVRVFNKTIKTLGLCSHFSINEHSMQNPKFTILKAVINVIEIYINCHVFSVELQSDSMRSSDHTQTRCTLQENSVVIRIKSEFTRAINSDYFFCWPRIGFVLLYTKHKKIVSSKVTSYSAKFYTLWTCIALMIYLL